MGDKRVNELTQISSAPGNGVLPIDVPGSEETNGITVDNLAKTMPVATSESNGMMSSNMINLLSHMDIRVAETGGGGILAEGVGFCFGYDKDNPTSYCLFSFVRMPGKSAVIRDKIAGTLTIGNQNEQGTSIINGATNYLSITLL